MQHLLSAWNSVSLHIKSAHHILLLSDYDGTLTPIVSRPEQAALSPKIKDTLRAIAQCEGVGVGIISGRSLPQTKSLVQIEGIFYAGNHGLELEGPGLEFVHPIAELGRSEIQSLASQLSQALEGIEGVIIENKGLTLSLHYRLVKESETEIVTDTLHKIIAPSIKEGKIKLYPGKKVWEARPSVDWGKGEAVNLLLTKVFQGKDALPIYLGDDLTDEDGFRAVWQKGGWGVFVGGENPSSLAQYFLNSPSEVGTFLELLLELRRGT